MNKNVRIYLLITFFWTWCGWTLAYIINRSIGSKLSTDGTVFNLITSYWGSNRFLPQLIFSLAVYGPLIGYISMYYIRKQINLTNTKKPYWLLVLIIPVISVFPAFILSAITSYFKPESSSIIPILSSILLYFISNLVTSGTEEFGWRGVLYPALKISGMSFWEIALKGGFIWAIWHYPLMVIMYLPYGFAVLIPSLIGFTASIIAMNYITNFIYEVSGDIWQVVLLHSLNNTMSFVLMLLFPGTPFTIVSSLMAWVIVWWIEKNIPVNIGIEITMSYTKRFFK